MSAIGGYRDGILRTVDRLIQQQEESKENIANRKESHWILPKESTEASPSDYIVEWRSQKRKAQELIDTGEYSGEKLERLKEIVDAPDNPPVPTQASDSTYLSKKSKNG